jgi:hypothetical protein
MKDILPPHALPPRPISGNATVPNLWGGFFGHPTLSSWFTNEYKKSGKKLDMGKGCVRFKSLEDLALDVVGRTVARLSAEEHMANYQAARETPPQRGWRSGRAFP